jgi:hypothetical protein
MLGLDLEQKAAALVGGHDMHLAVGDKQPLRLKVCGPRHTNHSFRHASYALSKYAGGAARLPT